MIFDIRKRRALDFDDMTPPWSPTSTTIMKPHRKKTRIMKKTKIIKLKRYLKFIFREIHALISY